MPFCAAGPMI